VYDIVSCRVSQCCSALHLDSVYCSVLPCTTVYSITQNVFNPDHIQSNTILFPYSPPSPPPLPNARTLLQPSHNRCKWFRVFSENHTSLPPNLNFLPSNHKVTPKHRQLVPLRLPRACVSFRGRGPRLYVLQHTATHCNTLQHTATHCNTLQHTAT